MAEGNPAYGVNGGNKQVTRPAYSAFVRAKPSKAKKAKKGKKK